MNTSDVKIGDYATGLSIMDGQVWWHSGRVTTLVSGYYVINGWYCYNVKLDKKCGLKHYFHV